MLRNSGKKKKKISMHWCESMSKDYYMKIKKYVYVAFYVMVEIRINNNICWGVNKESLKNYIKH